MDIAAAIVLVLLVLLPIAAVLALFVWAAHKDGQADRALQRRLGIGYPRAARLIDMLEEQGVISGAEGGGSREVFRTSEHALADAEELRF